VTSTGNVGGATNGTGGEANAGGQAPGMGIESGGQSNGVAIASGGSGYGGDPSGGASGDRGAIGAGGKPSPSGGWTGFGWPWGFGAAGMANQPATNGTGGLAQHRNRPGSTGAGGRDGQSSGGTPGTGGSRLPDRPDAGASQRDAQVCRPDNASGTGCEPVRDASSTKPPDTGGTTADAGAATP
jgi:hypothetical protein